MSDFWYGVMIFMFYIPVIFLWGFALFDLFSRRDLSGLAKASWLILILFLPLFGVLIYFLVRPKTYDSWVPQDSASTFYASGPSYASAQPSGAARDIDTLSRLHDQGTLTDEEFKRMKEQALAQPST